MSNNFGSIEKKTGVKMSEVVQFANSIKNANFQDENTVRDIVRGVSKLAQKPISKQKENMIVKAIVTGKVPKDMKEIEKMMGKK